MKISNLRFNQIYIRRNFIRKLTADEAFATLILPLPQPKAKEFPQLSELAKSLNFWTLSQEKNP